uniref:Uncharacterized protein n=1 Tax=Avena sativa TaxID=4498 RepID=A0ACD5VAK5_AVESA
MTADLLEKRIEDVGKENVVQVVTDNGANYKVAGKILMERIPTLYWSPCACHCLDLMLEDVGKLKEFKRPIARGKRVTNFIYRHGGILSLMRKATGGLDLVRPAATRFATSYLALKSLVKHKQELRSLFTCQGWIDAQAILYEDKRGAFANVMAIYNMVKRNPLDWWRSYGGRAIELQRFAKRIVSLCASSSGCERNWSTFEFIHTKKRNRLQHRILNDNVFVSYNRKNMDRFQKRREKIGDKSYDPLIIEDFDWGNEWVDPTLPPPQGARGCPDDIDWGLVDEAVGASSSLQGRNFPRASRTVDRERGPSTVNLQYQRQRKRPAPTILDESDQEDNHEQHSSIPIGEDHDSDFLDDDLEVTDDDEDPTNADQESGDDTNATIDEFDDGYV